MKHLIRLTDYNPAEIKEIFEIADALQNNKYTNILKGKTVIMFFPNTSIRTRVTFEKGIFLLGGQALLFPTETLDKKEELQDVFGYLNNWADLVIVRHKKIEIIEQIARYSSVPVINAMTDINHPCEILSDLYAFSKIRPNLKDDKFLFCGGNGNIGLAWKEASDVIGFDLEQCCGEGYEIEGLVSHYDIEKAIMGKDIVCTDSLQASMLEDFKKCQVTKRVMDKANKGALLNPCPPFYRGEEVSEDVINSNYFVGYEFKKSLLQVQQAIMIYCLTR
jgi:ornithine carbamoyltransferase